jgi:hypothetical protein
LGGCASESETAALNVGAYQRCVSEAEIVAADPAVECGPNAESFRPSFGQKFRYLYHDQRAQQQAQQAQQQAVRQAQQKAQQPQQQVRQRSADPCRAAYAAGLGAPTRTGRFGEALSNAQRYYLACRGVQLPPEPSPPVVVQQPERPPRHVMCQTFGTIVMCDEF